MPAAIPIDPHPAQGHRWRSVIGLAVVILIAAAVRLPGLDRRGYVLDEAWSLEIANGRGSLHEHLPLDRLSRPIPRLSALADAAPWWQVWSHVEVTHPPLYPLALRGWETAFGDGDLAGRLLSVIAGLVAVALLFDVVRLQRGTGAALWAGLLLAVAIPQVEHARLARSYTLLTAAALAAADAAVRLQHLGPTRRRQLALAVAALATLLTHYFCVGALLGLGVAFVRRSTRRAVLIPLAVAGLVFAIAWSPFMWRQRHLFATDDPNTQFLSQPVAHPAALTGLRVLVAPAAMLLPYPVDAMVTVAAGFGFILLVLPLFARRSPGVMFWWCWTWATVAVVAALDLARGTGHLAFPRYIFLAGPGVCGLLVCLALAARPPRWLAILVAVVTVGGCATQLSQVDANFAADPRAVVAQLPVPPGPSDTLIFAARPEQVVDAESACLTVTRYLRAPRCDTFAILTRPADTDTVSHLRGTVYLFTSAADYRDYLPAAPRAMSAGSFRGIGNLWILQYDR